MKDLATSSGNARLARLVPGGAVSLLGGLLLLAMPTAARGADPRAEAKADLVAGMSQLDKGDYEGALRKFEAAFALVPSPKVQFDMGLALQGLDRNVQALESFDGFLAGATDVPQEKRDQAERHRRELLAKVTAITVSADEAGISVAIDGVSRGKTPLAHPVYVETGSHQLIAQKPGLAPEPQSFTAVKGAALTIPIVLAGAQKVATPVSQPVPNPAPPAPAAHLAPPSPIGAARAPVPAAPVPESSPSVLVSQPTQAQEDGGSVMKKPWFWAVVGGGVAVAVVVGVLLATGGSKDPSASMGKVSGN